MKISNFLLTIIAFCLAFYFNTELLFAQKQPTMEEIIKMMEQSHADPALIESMKQMNKDSNMQKMMNNAKEKQDNSTEAKNSEALYRVDDFYAPPKDASRISTVSKKIMSSDELAAFLVSTTLKVESVLPDEDKKMASFIINYFKDGNADSLAMAANGLWLNASYKSALMLMGRASKANPNPDNLNNYAAFLVMSGGEELALPILFKLNSEFPKNSTILNNIGQAWFGLGDLQKANQYLDSTVMIFAAHPQANLTKAVIDNKNGNKNAAQEALKKSIYEAYSTEKEAMLSHLQYQVSGKDLKNNIHMPEDPLGFEKWLAEIPAFPMNYNEVLARTPLWNEYFKKVELEENDLRAKMAGLQKEIKESIKKGRTIYKLGSGRTTLNLSPKAQHIINYYGTDKDGRKSYQAGKSEINGEWWTSNLDSAILQLNKEELAINKKHMGDPEIAKCPDLIAAHNKFIQKVNINSEKLFWENMNREMPKIKLNAYTSQFSSSSQTEIDAAVIGAKLEFLYLFDNMKPTLILVDGLPPEICFGTDQTDKPLKANKLPDFDDIHCDKVISMVFPGIGSWKITCNRAEFHLNPLIIPIERHFTENLNTGEYITSSAAIGYGPVKAGGEYNYEEQKGKVELGLSGKLSESELGPIPLEVSANLSAALEFDRNGISDLEVGASLEGKAGNDSGSVSVEAGEKWSWNAGCSAEGKVTLGGLPGNTINNSN